jgi:hypothetical protein
MVKSEELYIGLSVYKIEEPHVQGQVQGIGVLGKPKWFKVMLNSGQLILVQKPELWNKLDK